MTRSDRDDSDERDEQGGKSDGSGIHIDIGLSVSDLIRELRDRSETRQSRDSLGVRPNRPSGRRGQSSGRRDGRDESEYHVESHQEGDELVVLADLQGVDADAVTAGIDDRGSEFVVAVRGTVVERISLPWDQTEVVDNRFNNGVLEIRLRRGD